MLTQEEMMAIQGTDISDDYLAHYGILGMKWGIRRYETKSGHLTPAGKARYDSDAYKKHGVLKGIQSARTGPSRPVKTLLEQNSEKRKNIAKGAKVVASNPTKFAKKVIGNMKEKRRIEKKTEKINKERAQFARTVESRNEQNKHFGAKLGIKAASIAAKTALSVGVTAAATKLATEGGIAAALGTVGLGAAATFLRTSIIKTTNRASYQIANKVIKDQYDIPLSQIPKQLTEKEVKEWEEKQREEAKKLSHSFENEDYLAHYGILGMKWGIRRYQNKDGSLTNAGKARYNDDGVRRANQAKPSGTPSTSSKSVEQKHAETDDEMKSRLMKNPNANEVAKNIDKFTTAELNEMANRSNALQRMRNDARMDEQYRKQQYKLEQEEALKARQDKIDQKLRTFKNYADAVHTGISLLKDAAYIAKTISYGAKITKSIKEKDTTAAFDYLIEWCDGKTPKNQNKPGDTSRAEPYLTEGMKQNKDAEDFLKRMGGIKW